MFKEPELNVNFNKCHDKVLNLKNSISTNMRVRENAIRDEESCAKVKFNRNFYL